MEMKRCSHLDASAGQDASLPTPVQWGYLSHLPSAWIVTLVVFTLIEPFKLDIMWNLCHTYTSNTVALTVEFQSAVCSAPDILCS